MKNLSSKIFIMLAFVCGIACSTRTVLFKTVIHYKPENASHWKQKKKSFRITVPQGFTKNKILGDHETEIQLIYPDSSIIYISDDLESGSYTNWKNLEKAETKVYDYLYKDTVANEGLTKSGYWKELKLKYVIVGYLNVPKEQKEIFEESLKSIK